MQKDLPVDIEAGQALYRACISGHRNVPHALSGLGSQARRDQFVVAPHRPVEEQQRCAVKPRLQLIGDIGAGGDEVEVLAPCLVADAQAERVARTIAAAGMHLAFEVPGAFAGYGEGKDFQTRRRAIGEGGFEGAVDRDRLAPHMLFAQHIEDAVVAQDRQHLLMGVDRKRRTLAHREQASHRIDLAIGQDHARDRRMAQRAFPWMKLWGCDQLLAQVGGGVDEVPVIAVGADRNRGLRAAKFGMLAPGRPAHLAAAIPLRYAAAGGCAQDDDAKHDPSPENKKRENSSPNATKVNTGPDMPLAQDTSPRRSTCVEIREVSLADYLRVALTYMLISMPHGTSTIFGAFQAILALLASGINSPAITVQLTV